MYPQRIAIIVLALFLGACAGSFLDFSRDAQTPVERLAAATGYYALAESTVNDLRRDGAISADVFVNKVSPAREAARASIAEAENVIRAFAGESNDVVQKALDAAYKLALAFHTLSRELK